MIKTADAGLESTPALANNRQDGYTWTGVSGWKSYRALRPFRGMYYDVLRRAPYYASDITDGFSYRVFAATIRMYFVNLLPALAFQLDMLRRTDGYFGINEALFASALAAIVFSLFAAQPLTIVGITGLISLFNYTIYDIAVRQGIGDLYPQFIAWVSIWAAITHWIASIGNFCDYMRYITDFSSNAFGMYVGIIYMIKGVEELVAQFDNGASAAGYLSVVIALCYWFTVYMLELLPRTVLFHPFARRFLSDYAYPIATIFWTGFSHINGTIKRTPLLDLPITKAFRPTVDRSWFVQFYNLPVKWVFVALPIGILLTLLFYYDHVSFCMCKIRTAQSDSRRTSAASALKPDTTRSKSLPAFTGTSFCSAALASSAASWDCLCQTVSCLRRPCTQILLPTTKTKCTLCRSGLILVRWLSVAGRRPLLLRSRSSV